MSGENIAAMLLKSKEEAEKDDKEDKPGLRRRKSSFEHPLEKQKEGGSGSDTSLTRLVTQKSREHILSYDMGNFSTAYEFMGLRFLPCVITFNNVYVGQTYTVELNVQNISCNIVQFRIKQPFSRSFKVNDRGTIKTLAPGIVLTKIITYKCTEGSLSDSVISIVVATKDIHLPIKVYKGEAKVLVFPEMIDFGRLDIGCPYVTKQLSIINQGSCVTKGSIDLGINELGLVVSPKTFQVAPYGKAKIKIQIAGLIVGEHSSEFWVKSAPSHRIQVKVKVVFPYFKALHPNSTGNFTLIDLQATFPGAKRYETLIVRNVSSFQGLFVTSVESENSVITLKEAEELDPTYKSFSVYPLEGKMLPFEGKIFTIWFDPKFTEQEKGWHRDDTITEQFLIFLRIQRVDVMYGAYKGKFVEGENMGSQFPILEEEDLPGDDATLLPSMSSLSENDDSIDVDIENTIAMKDGSVQLCLYGVGVHPMLQIIPNELIFENVLPGSKHNKVLALTNMSTGLSMGFRYFKIPSIEITPNFQFLKYKESVEVLVTLIPGNLNLSNKYITFELLSHENHKDKLNVTVVGHARVKLKIQALAPAIKPKPEINLGISPKLIIESGAHTNLITYNSDIKFPKSLVIPSSKNRPWLNSDARVVLPNEMGRIRPLPSDKKARTIFTGLRRYIKPPDYNYRRTKKEEEKRQKNRNRWHQYLTDTGEMAKQEMKDQEREALNEYSVSNPKSYNMTGGMLEPLNDESCMTTCVGRKETPLPDTCCPLVPMHLFNIRVKPKEIDFGKIPPGVDCKSHIVIENLNPFDISVKLFFIKDSQHAPPSAFIVKGGETAKKDIVINLEALGKHFSNMYYIINTHHRFDLKVAAEVVQRTLDLKPAELTMYETQYSDIFLKIWAPVKVINPLGVPTKFKWKISQPCPFYITPQCGIVPGNGVINCTVYFQFRDRYSLGTVASFLIDKGTQLQYPINYIIDTPSCLSIFMPKISCPNIPLGLPFKKKVILFNHGSVDCFFSISNQNPHKGVTINPIAGLLKAKAGFVIEIVFKMTSITSFDFRTDIETEGDTCLQLKVNGYVVYPSVSFKPMKIIFRGGPCYSFTTVPINIENQSLAEVSLCFPMRDFPQMKIAKTNKSSDEGIGDQAILINSQENMRLYLHFEPKDLAAYQFILPYVINRIIGPPLLDYPETWNPLYFTRAPPIKSMEAVKLKLPGMECPKTISCVNIHATSIRGFISCSKREMNFFKTPQSSTSSIDGTSIWQLFDITSLSKQTVTVILNLQEPIKYSAFSVKLLGDDNQIILKEPIQLEPNEGKTIAVSFGPPFPGIYEQELSITVKEYNEKRPYCFVKLNGVCHKSYLYCEDNLLHFLPVPIGVEVQRTITIVANYQSKDTFLNHSIVSLQGEPCNETLTVVYPNTNEISRDKENFIIPVQIKFLSFHPTTITGYILFTDGSEGETKLGFTATADSSLLTTYAHYYLTEMKDLAEYEKQYDFVHVDVYGIASVSMHPTHFASISEYPQTAKLSYSYIDLTTEIEANDYPLFPKSSSMSTYAVMMGRTVNAVEDWLYEQGFAGVYRMTIGEHMSFSKHYQTAVNSRSKNPYYAVVKSLLDLVIRYAGREFHSQYIIPPSIPPDDDGRIMYCLTTYKQILQFLKTQGAYLSHVFPLYLLDYDDYVQFYTKIKPTSDKVGDFMVFSTKSMLKEEKYNRYTIQCWLDVLLQLYKVLVLGPTIELRTKSSELVIEPTCIVDDGVEGENIDKKSESKIDARKLAETNSKILATTTIRTVSECVKGENESTSERALLKWMNEIFEKKRQKWLSLNPRLKLPPRTIRNFTSDLTDAVVLIAITTYYCPYLTAEFFSTAFFDPTDPSQYQHNACLLSLAWVSIHLGLSTSARDFRSPNPILMIFLVGHLFSVLRSYVPETVLQFSSCLNATMQRKFHITNPSQQTIGYFIKKIGDPHNLFSISPHKNVILVQGKSTAVVTIKYYSKSLNKVKATLLFCGCGQPGAFATNMVLTIEGEPKKFQVKNYFKINTPLFKAATINIGIISPFSTGGIFDIWYSEDEPKPGIKSNMRPWREIKRQTVPRCLYLNTDTIELFPTHSSKPSLLSIVTASYTMKAKDFWLFFRNATIGDFITKIQVIPRVEMPFYSMTIPLMTAPCAGVPDVMCVSQCPRLVMITFPARNTKFWATANTMLSLTMNKSDKAFWSAYVEKPIGIKLIKWMLCKTENSIANEIDFIFNPTVIYNVKCDCPYIEHPSTFTIQDVLSDSIVEFPIHIKSDVTTSLSANIRLTSLNGKEIRLYNINIVKRGYDKDKRVSSNIRLKKKVETVEININYEFFRVNMNKPKISKDGTIVTVL